MPPRRAARGPLPTAPLPALYLSHGAPPLLEDAGWMDDLHAWARRLPAPRAILIVSAHWESAPLALSTADGRAELVYDFGGFDPCTTGCATTRPTPTTSPRSSAPCCRTPSLCTSTPRAAWTTAHGCRCSRCTPTPRCRCSSSACPPTSRSGSLTSGAGCAPCAGHGVLVVGSGFMTHGLPFLKWGDLDAVPTWSAEFDAWAGDALARGDVDELAAYRDRAPGMPYAHPTVEHFTPIFLTLGAATEPGTPATTALDGFWWGLARRSVEVA